ncbi:heterogeneous nuclear ribonucleoprotein Q-like isoform X2 [Panicum hallii]|uniref:heterogeneous nuclear ribonucleoprotein Q-like isoform X2 n=1 Tax=Panicum hallii TaxID=206008 RepID=UPI000DF4E6A6|nr:heterogeneous nuclear ribonucleoprotein Q-like isoform X2 [Panicum hallii]
MTTSATADATSPVRTVTEGETPAAADVGAAVEEGEEMNVGAAAADEEHGQVELEEDPDEQVEDEEEVQGDAGEVEGGDVMGAALIEPLVALKPGEEDEPEELDEESEEATPSEEEPEEVEEGKEEYDDVEEKGLVCRSAANDTNEVSKQEHGKCGNTNKDKVADEFSKVSDSCGSKSNDAQNSELAGGLEIFVDQLPKDCVEEDIAMVFSQCGDVKSVRIIKNSSSEKNKDIAFVCYASIEAAKKALVEFKEGIEVKGEKVRVSACQDNNALYLGNICKGWTKDQVLTTLKSIGIQDCEISFPTSKRGSRGFAFLKFASHYYARAAFRRLIKPDAIFGTDRSPKVSFYQPLIKPSENLTEAKKVYLEHVPLSWDEDKIKECCQQYGKILKVDLLQISKNMDIETFSFVEFSSSKSALACVEGINNVNIVDGGFKLSACLARPKSGLKVNSGAASEGATTSKKEKAHTGKVIVNKDSPHKLSKGNKKKLTCLPKEILVKTNSPSKLPNDYDVNLTSQDAALQISNPSKGKRKVGNYKNASVNQKPSKKQENNRNVDGSQGTSQRAVLKTSNSSRRKRKPGKNKNIYRNERPLKRAHNNSNMDGSSRSKAYASDLEPHAGFIPPASRVHSTHAYDRQRNGEYGIQPIDRHPYARASRAAYCGHTSHADYEAGYTYVYPPPPPPS